MRRTFVVGTLLLGIGISCILTGCQATPSLPSNGAVTAESLMEGAPARSPQSTSYDRLWAAAEDAARDMLFTLDRQDRRNGVLTTMPLTGAQWFEPWRPDNQTTYDVAVSSLSAVRRTVRFEFVRASDAQNSAWIVRPKVLVERQSKAERRITSSAQYRSVLLTNSSAQAPASGAARALDPDGPDVYWYAISRDAALEKELARRIESRLR